MDRISDLPLGILHRILYFLSQEEAVRTSVLAKSWRYNWCTRPNVDFSDTIFKANKPDFVDKTLHGYYDQKLSVEEFHLSVTLDGYWEHKTVWVLNQRVSDEWVWLLEKWIPLLTNMGLKKFRLSCHSEYSRLPTVVFLAKSLQDLHLEGFELDQNAIERIVLFKHLRSLCLQRVHIMDGILEKIIAHCPLIETLNVQGDCRMPGTIKLNELHNLKYLSFLVCENVLRDEEPSSIEIHPPSSSFKTIDISRCNIWFHEGAEFRNLRDLSLSFICSSLECLSSCKFPRLKRLTLSHCGGLKDEIQLFIDAPKINYFEYQGLLIPSISFATTTSIEWRSHIYLTYWSPDDDSSLWFLKLKELLKSLSQSEISLYVRKHQLDTTIQENTLVRDNDCDKPVVVEWLELHCDCDLSSFSSLVDGMFGICRPRNIHNFLDEWEIQIVKFELKFLMEGESGTHDQLEEVSFEMKERNRGEWHPATLSEFIENRKQSDQIQSRFTLKWRDNL